MEGERPKHVVEYIALKEAAIKTRKIVSLVAWSSGLYAWCETGSRGLSIHQSNINEKYSPKRFAAEFPAGATGKSNTRALFATATTGFSNRASRSAAACI